MKEKLLVFHWLFWITILFLVFTANGKASEEISDLYIKKQSDVPEEGIPRGNRITYTVSFRNNGPNIATDVVIEDIYNDTNNQTDFEFPKNCNDTGECISCYYPALEVGIEQTFTYSAKISDTADLGGMISYINIYSDQKDYDERDNLGKIHFQIIPQKKEQKKVLSGKKKSNAVFGFTSNPDQEDEGELLSESNVEPIKVNIDDVNIGPVFREENTPQDISLEDIQMTPQEISVDVEKPKKIMTESEYGYFSGPEKNADSGTEIWILALFSFVFGVCIHIFKRVF